MLILEKNLFHRGRGHTIRVHANIKLVLLYAVEDTWQSLALMEWYRDAELMSYVRLDLVSVDGLLQKGVQL